MENADLLLLRGIKSILRCDEAEVVSGIARYITSKYRSLRIGSALMERARATPIPAIVALLGALTRFLEVRAADRRDGAVWVARLGNERRAIEMLPPLVPELNWTELKFRRRPDLAAISALVKRISRLRRILKIARRLHQRYEFFQVLRVVELIGYYSRYLGIFRHGQFCLALMSSHSNPHGIAFNLAARRCGVPVALITHGMPVRPVARLSFDLAVVHCDAARQTYLAEGCRMDRILIHGRRQNHVSMPADKLPVPLVVGIFLCKDINEERLRAVTEHLRADPRVSGIVIRPHPKNLWLGLDEWIASLHDPRVRLSSGTSVFRDIEEADIVLAGNSSVLVDAVTAGRPSGYVPGLDCGPFDMHEFVARGLIYSMADEAGEPGALKFDPEVMLRFYQRPGWPNVLRLFANVDEDEASVGTQLSVAVRELIASRAIAMANERTY